MNGILSKYTIGSIKRELTQMFKEKGLETPDLDARLIVMASMGLDRALKPKG